MSLGEFHNMDGAENSTTAQNVVVTRTWAEEMDQQDPYDDQSQSTTYIIDRSQLPTAPKSVLGPDIDLNLVPKERPFRANLSNISYDAEESHIRKFFNDKKIENINLVKTDRGTGHRGFGFIDFDDRETLIEALSKNDTLLLSRKMRVVLYDPNNKKGDRDDGHPLNKSDMDNDWRKPRQNNDDEISNDNVDNRRDHRSGGGGGGGSGGYQNRYNNYNRNRGGQHQQNDSNWNDNRNRNRNNYHQKSNDDSMHDSGNRGGQYEGGNRGGQYEGGNRGNQYEGGNRGGQYEGGNRGGQYEGGGNRGGQYEGGSNRGNRFGGYRNRPHNEHRSETSGEPSFEAPQESEAPKERPKIHLAPRTVPIEVANESTSSSIFGSAKPVDTAARERAIEEKLKAAEAQKQAEAKEEKLQDDNIETKSTTTSSEYAHQKPYRGDRSERSDRSERGDRNDRFYSAKAKHRNYQQDGNQSYDSSNPTSPQQPQQQQHYQQDRNRDRNQQYNNRRSNYQHNESNNLNTSTSSNRGNRSFNNDETRSAPKETIEAPPPTVNAWQARAVTDLFKDSQSSTVNTAQDEVPSPPQPQQQQTQASSPPPQSQQRGFNQNTNNDNNNNRPNNFKNRSNKPYQSNNETNNNSYSKENRNQNRRYNDSNNNNTLSNNNKKFTRKGDRNFNDTNENRKAVTSAGVGEERQKQYKTQQPKQNEENIISNKFSNLDIEDEVDDE